jgi:hypothetical protein
MEEVNYRENKDNYNLVQSWSLPNHLSGSDFGIYKGNEKAEFDFLFWYNGNTKYVGISEEQAKNMVESLQENIFITRDKPPHEFFENVEKEYDFGLDE